MDTKPFLSTFFLLCFLTVQSQTQFTPEVLSSAGEHLQSPNVNAEFTLGEFVVGTIGTVPKATQGFNQPGLDLMIRVIDLQYEGKIRVFPNPANEVLNVTIDSQEGFDLRLYDPQGILMLKSDFYTATQLDVSKLMPGAYFLDIRKKDAPVFSVIIEKMK